MEGFNDERVKRMEFLLEKMKDGEIFYFNGQAFYFSCIGHLCFYTTNIIGQELKDGKYKNVYEPEISEVPLNHLLDLYKTLSSVRYETDLTDFKAYEFNKN